MLKIGNTKIDTYPLSKCNLKNSCQKIYLIPTDITFCPICGKKVKTGHCYAMRISESECVKIYGDACYDCSAFFSTSISILHYIEKHPYASQSLEFVHDFDLPLDLNKHLMHLRNGSAFLQYFLYIPGEIACYTLVYDSIEANETQGVYYFASKTGLAILAAEIASSNSVILKNREYKVLQVKRRSKLFDKIKDEVYSVEQYERVLSGELPAFTSESTLYIYNGNINCHKKHHIIPYRAHIESFDREIGFYVEYCVECDKFLMKHDDYSVYLKRYKFFPMRIDRTRNNLDEYGRAETSELFDNGYTVNQSVGLTENQRHEILAFMIDYGIMEQRKILNHLEMLINTNGQSERNVIALSKWINDKQFVLNYKLTDKPMVKVGHIERR